MKQAIDRLIGMRETGQRLGVSAKTLRIWDENGKFNATTRTIGGHRRYSLGQVEALIKPEVFPLCVAGCENCRDESPACEYNPAVSAAK